MPQIEYSDLYKFTVSTGIALMSAAFLLPWIFLREPFDLFLEPNKFLLLSPGAQSIILRRQQILTEIIYLLPLICVVLLLVGAFLVIFGLTQWHRRQQLRDKSEQLGVKKQEVELEKMSHLQVEAKHRDDIPDEDIPGLVKHDMFLPPRQYQDVESKIAGRLGECFGQNHQILRNQRLGSAEYDLILRSKDSAHSDIIIEVNYITRGFGEKWLRESSAKFALACDVYRVRFLRKTKLLIIIVTAESASDRDGIHTKVVERVHQDNHSMDTDVRVLLIKENEISTVDCKRLHDLIAE